LKRETAAAAKIDKQFHYFDGLKKLAGTLTQEASGLLDTTKEFRSKLQSTQAEIKQDFNDSEIDDQLGDLDFVNDFADNFSMLLIDLTSNATLSLLTARPEKIVSPRLLSGRSLMKRKNSPNLPKVMPPK
jgi:hypothetical protein